MAPDPIQVLLIEDDRNHAHIARALIKSGDDSISCDWVETLADGLNRLDAGGIDVVLLDFGLPDSHGLDTFLRLQAHSPSVAVIPLTGTGDDALALNAVHLGAQDYLFKGAVNQQLLTRAIRYAFERKRQEEALRRARDELELRVAERTAELRDLYDAERRARETAETLRAANLALTRSLNLDEVLTSLLDCLAHLVPYDSACVMLHTGDSQLGVYVAHGYEQWPQSEPMRRIVFDAQAHPHLGRILFQGESVLIPDTSEEPSWDATIGGGAVIRNWLGVPLAARGRVFGLYSMDKGAPGFFTAEHRQLAEMLTAQAAAAIDNARLFADVHSREEQLRALSRRLVEVQESERRLIARELHDEIGQMLTGLKLLLGTALRLPPETMGERLSQAQELLNELMGRVRNLSLDLRPAMLDDLGLLHALFWHFERYTQQTGIEIQFTHTGIEGRRFAHEIETAAYRLIQEALTNVARYAGVGNTSVHVWASDDLLTVQVEDRGCGFDPETAIAAGRSNGLAGMRERAELLGGSLTIDSSPCAGANLTANLPLKAHDEDSSSQSGEGRDAE